jgi:glycosyltransferase involved in cell wall biosynthesis
MNNKNIQNKIALTDTWYHNEIPDATDSLQKLIHPILARIVLRFSLLRAIFLLIHSKKYPLLVTCWHGTGRFLIVLAMMFGIKKIVLLEFIDFNYPKKTPIIAIPYGFLVKYILSPALNRSTLRVHVLTDWERPFMSQRYNYPEDQIIFISWPLILGEVETRPFDLVLPQAMVFSSGRASCDWDLLFAACEIGHWPLTVVCTAEDLPRVTKLNEKGLAKVYSEIPKAQHDELFSSATIYALCLKEATKSSGQIRLACSIEAGVPVVATNVKGLEGYLLDGITAKAVPAGDAKALSNAIEYLLSNAIERTKQATVAFEYSKRFDRKTYINSIINLLNNCIAEVR